MFLYFQSTPEIHGSFTAFCSVSLSASLVPLTFQLCWLSRRFILQKYSGYIHHLICIISIVYKNVPVFNMIQCQYSVMLKYYQDRSGRVGLTEQWSNLQQICGQVCLSALQPSLFSLFQLQLLQLRIATRVSLFYFQHAHLFSYHMVLYSICTLLHTLMCLL